MDIGLEVFGTHRDGHFPFSRELDRVRDQVDDDLLQPRRVGHQTPRNTRVDLIAQRNAFLARYTHKQIDRLGDAGPQFETMGFEFDAPGFDLRKIQNVVDDRQEGIAAGADDLDVLALLARERGAQQQAGHADDAVHGGSDLVAHHGQELAAGLGGGFGSVFGLFEHRLGLLTLGDVDPHPEQTHLPVQF